MGAFAGMKDNSAKDFQSLLELTPAGTIVVLFTPREVNIPAGWIIQVTRPLLQMVCQRSNMTAHAEAPTLVRLEDQHIPAMIDLTSRTNPGPFLERTIDFGNYEGVFHDGQLAAMTGQRLQPDPYTEVSAVCTDPAFTGRGYAAALIRSQAEHIRQEGRIPFLHVLPDNTKAVNLYLKLGFEPRATMRFYVLRKEGA